MLRTVMIPRPSFIVLLFWSIILRFMEENSESLSLFYWGVTGTDSSRTKHKS